MTRRTRLAAVLLALATLGPWALAAPRLSRPDAEAPGCGGLPVACCCGDAAPAVPATDAGCACRPSPERAPTPAPAPPADDAPRAPSPACADGRLVDAADGCDAASLVSDLFAVRPGVGPPARLAHCVLRL